MQQEEQREEWIRRHTWGATAMDQGDQWKAPPEDEKATAGAISDLLEDGEVPDGTPLPPSPPHAPRIVEGTLVESTPLVPTPPPSSITQGEEDGQHPLRALRRWVRQSLLTVLLALLTVVALTPTQPRVMRLFVTLVPAAGATATITVITDQVDLHGAYTLLAVPDRVVVPAMSQQQPQTQIEARLLATPTLAQTITVPTTGRGHQSATQAHGLVTFYNQAPTAQVIPAGMLLSGVDGVQVVTNQAVAVPAAHLPAQGQVTVAAHAVQTGPKGNMEANDLNGLCCFAGIAVQNAQAFVGGANNRDFPVVGEHDVSESATSLATTLTSQGQAKVQAQVHQNEQLVHAVQCPSQVTATPAVGEEATQVTVMVRVTCHAEVYNADELQAKVSVLLGQEATTRLGNGYTLQREVTANLSTLATFDARHGIISLYIQADGVWAYQLSAAQLHALATLVAGKPLWQAQTILLHMQNIHQVSISSTDWWDDANQQALPQDPNQIRVAAINWAGV